MSNIIKGIGKVFKSVIKVVAKIAPYVLMAAAVYFTAGAALGVTAGWGATASALSASIAGAGSTLGGIMAGALTYGGYGAIAGGVLAAATGKSIGKGIETGGLVGMAAGGAMGALGMTPAVAAGAEGIGGVPAAAGTSTLGSGGGQIAVSDLGAAPGSMSTAEMAAEGAGTGALPTASSINAAGMANFGGGAAGGAGAGTAAAGGAAASTGVSGFLNTNAGAGLIAGAGTGLMQMVSGNDPGADQNAQTDRLGQNYSNPNGVGLFTPRDVQRSTRPSVLDPTDPSNAPGQYVADLKLGRIVWVPSGATA